MLSSNENEKKEGGGDREKAKEKVLTADHS